MLVKGATGNKPFTKHVDDLPDEVDYLGYDMASLNHQRTGPYKHQN